MIDRYNSKNSIVGTLYLTATHLIFVDPEANKETWVSWRWKKKSLFYLVENLSFSEPFFSVAQKNSYSRLELIVFLRAHAGIHIRIENLAKTTTSNLLEKDIGWKFIFLPSSTFSCALNLHSTELLCCSLQTSRDDEVESIVLITPLTLRAENIKTEFNSHKY